MALSKNIILNTLSVAIAASALIGCGRNFEAVKVRKDSGTQTAGQGQKNAEAQTKEDGQTDENAEAAETEEGTVVEDGGAAKKVDEQVAPPTEVEKAEPKKESDSALPDTTIAAPEASLQEKTFLGIAGYYDSERLIVKTIVKVEDTHYVYIHMRKHAEITAGQAIEMPLFGIERLSTTAENVISSEERAVLSQRFGLSLNCEAECRSFVATLTSGEVIANATLVKDTKVIGVYGIDSSASLKSLKNADQVRLDLLKKQVQDEAASVLRSIQN